MEGHGHISENYETGRRHLSVSPDGRPRSCCEVPRVPGIKYVEKYLVCVKRRNNYYLQFFVMLKFYI